MAFALTIILIGFVVGLATASWWALAAAAAFGLWVGLIAEVDLPAWLIGLFYGLIAGAGVAAGVALRRALARREAGRG